jgi:hypothetical protein
MTLKDKLLFPFRLIWLGIYILAVFTWFASTATKEEKERFERYF